MFFTVRLKPKNTARLIVVLVVAALLFSSLYAVSTINPNKVVYLTFDDGPSAMTPELLAVLKKYDVRATFFVCGQYGEYSGTLKQIADDGHLIALHTYSHRFSEIYDSPDAFWNDIQRLELLVFTETGANAGRIIRFAGGSSNTVCRRYGGKEIMQKIIAQCDEYGYVYVDWNVDTKDAESSAAVAPETIRSRALKGLFLQNSPVILMHDGKSNTTVAQAAELLIVELLDKGYTFDTVDHLTEEIHHRLPK